MTSIHYIDVGHGDATLIVSNKHTMLLDCGNRNHGSHILTYISQLGIDHLDGIIVTHPHCDHDGALPHIISNIHTTAVYVHTSNTRMYSTDTPVYCLSAGDTLHYNAVKYSILGPVTSYTTTNNQSLIVRVDASDCSALFTGDIASRAEQDLVTVCQANLLCDIIHVPHHGSNSASCPQLLAAVQPDYAIISCGNQYGLPHPHTLSRYSTYSNATVLTTSDCGTIIANLAKGTITMVTQ